MSISIADNIVNSDPVRYGLGMPQGAPPTRVRRSATEARERILEAAGRRILAEGPAALRLQELAADVGVSHPTILHHFGSREALVAEVLEREVRHLEEELVTAVAAVPLDEGAPTELLRRAMDAFLASGSARLLAFLALEGATTSTARSTPHVRLLAETIHARRVERTGPAPFEDTLHAVLSVTLALVADGLLGPGPWLAMGLDEAARARFHDWLLDRAKERIEAAPPSRTATGTKKPRARTRAR